MTNYLYILPVDFIDLLQSFIHFAINPSILLQARCWKAFALFALKVYTGLAMPINVLAAER